MATGMHGRFGDWYGTWRGPIELRAGSAGIMRLEIKPYFGGSTAEVHAIATDANGETLQVGFGYWWIGDDGLARSSIYGEQIGFTTMTEQPDDPDVLAFSGPYADGGTLTLLYALSGGVLQLTASVLEGYNDPTGVRTVARLRRVEPRRLSRP